MEAQRISIALRRSRKLLESELMSGEATDTGAGWAERRVI